LSAASRAVEKTGNKEVGSGALVDPNPGRGYAPAVRWTIVVTLAVVAFALAACGNDGDASDTTSSDKTTSTATSPSFGPPGKTIGGGGRTLDVPTRTVPKKGPKRERIDELGTATPEVKKLKKAGALTARLAVRGHAVA
jgi:hypothetical protein